MNADLLVSGANGFLGSAICRAALGRGLRVVGLIRPGATDRSLLPPSLPIAEGLFTDPESIRRVLAQTAPGAVIHAAAVVSTGTPDLRQSLAANVEGVRTFTRAAREAGVHRWVQISSMSAHPANKAVYGGTKLLADAVVQDSGLAWTILRPSIIYGSAPRGPFAKFVRLVTRLQVVPLVGTGLEPLRPVHVDDVATAALEAAAREGCIGRIYPIGGPDPVTFRELVRQTVFEGTSLDPILVPVPLALCRLIALAGEACLKSPPLTLDHIEGISRAVPVEIEAAIRDLDFKPRPFVKGLRECLPPLLQALKEAP